ncbi:hypothetical protein E8E14_002185 [Neopestalotiopsis sp. 37M]|nr:hypothetical protein E8E14_002185 [Neopestalotiopsis sp. 37M]
MSEPTTPDVKANSSAWNADEVSVLLTTIMTQYNEDLSVKGWNEIGQKLQAFWGDKLRFLKLRLAYLEKCQNHDGTATATPAKAATPRKRAAKVKGEQEDSEETPKKKRGRKPKAQVAQEEAADQLGAEDASMAEV